MGPLSGYLDPLGNLALNQFPENQLNQKPFTMLVEEGTFISNHKGELLNSKNEWHQAKIIRTTTKILYALTYLDITEAL